MSFFQNHSGWPLVPLKNIATLKRGYDLPVGMRNKGEVPIYAANGQNGSHDEVKINGPGVITGRSGTIGRVHYCEGGFWPLNTALYVMDFHGNHPRWVYYMLSAFKLERFSEGAGVPTLNRNLVHDELIPLPPLPEQKRIAAILDKADAIRRKRQQAIQLADDLLRAVFLDMFGDPVTNPKGWPRKALRTLGSSITGKTPPSEKAGMWGKGTPFVTPGDLNGCIRSSAREVTEEGLANSRLCRAGGLLVCCIGATIGKVGISESPVTFNQQINAQEWNCEVHDIYGYFVFKICPQLVRDGAIQTTLPILKKSLFDGIEIPVPPRAMQAKFAGIVESTLALNERNEVALSTLR